MTSVPCSVDGCERPIVNKRGWCSRHYRKVLVYGDPLAGGTHYKTPEESFAARVRLEGCCLVWTATKNGAGYGLINIGNRKEQLAHRYAWERVNGSIPDDLFLDHICHNRACVKVEHLRLASAKQNNENRHVKANKSGARGVSWDADRKKWVARVWHHNKCIFHKRFDDFEVAAEAARLVRLKYYTHNDHDRAA
ncbi:HNH endonuclease [Arthrobacter phage Jinkies]|uniref:HNH endonuclease n=1 Tax=Arthrobacter phage Jinkies TaxID=2743903 RepID=A0A7S6BF78_9CAUD|nr:HNH endonuclease [Arthrobacter phage Jinkies]